MNKKKCKLHNILNINIKLICSVETFKYNKEIINPNVK